MQVVKFVENSLGPRKPLDAAADLNADVRKMQLLLMTLLTM